MNQRCIIFFGLSVGILVDLAWNATLEPILLTVAGIFLIAGWIELRHIHQNNS